MLRINAIVASVEELILTRFPGLTAYRNVARQGFKRPSFLIEVSKQTMEDATRRTVDRTAQVKVTFFEPVDDYHDSQIDGLSDRLTVALELFSGGGVQVDDRFLDISGAKGEVGYDYAELNFILSWQDDRELEEVEGALMAQFDFEISEKEET